MARYIDADKATEEARLTYCKDCKSYNGVMCRACAFDDAMSFIDDFPEADLAPRSEVARQIFEEINAIKKEYASGDIDGNELYIRLYQLEKKYTEGNNESQNT